MTLDKQQIFSAGDGLSPRHDEWYAENGCVHFNHINGHHLSQKAFMTALNFSIEEALTSNQEMVKALAMFDKRVGKRRLQAMVAIIDAEPLLVKHFHALRCRAEGIPLGTAFSSITNDSPPEKGAGELLDHAQH